MSGHGLAGAICLDGEIVAATSLERLTRKKYDMLMPITKADLETFGWHEDPQVYVRNLDLPFDLEGDYSSVDFNKYPEFLRMIDYLLSTTGLKLSDVTTVAYSYRYMDSMRKFFAEHCPAADFVYPEHHFGHACQAFLGSPFDDAAIMVVDGQGVPLERTGGDQLSGCLAHGKGNKIEVLRDISVNHSLGGMYAAFTHVVGFQTNEEGKTMGLAPYGGSRYYDELKKELKFDTTEYNLRNVADLIRRGFRPKETLYRLPDYGRFLKQFKKRGKKEPITDEHRDLAFAVQELTEDVMVYLADWLHEATGSDNLCIAGGVGLNCVANYQVLVRSKFKNIFVHPNAGDNGLAVGQALYAYNIIQKQPRKYLAKSDSLGKDYSEAEYRAAVEARRSDPSIVIEEFADLDKMYDRMAADIEAGKITSWCQGRSEFGPRALGNRSILADPRRADMKDILNSRVKFREAFRPFTPSVLAERAQDYFELPIESPFMLMAAYVKPGMGDVVPAITHADNTARVQTVTRDVNERYYDLIKAFDRRTGVGLLLDTSFNVAGEPIVETPEDAIRCFMSTDIDVLCLDRFILTKKKALTA
jgi:carbamoyltransferase